MHAFCLSEMHLWGQGTPLGSLAMAILEELAYQAKVKRPVHWSGVQRGSRRNPILLDGKAHIIIQ